jgi:hypothetical protein
MAIVTASMVRADERPAATSAAARDPLAWPALTSENRPWARWWWLGSAVDKENLTALLQQYHDAGIGGLEICPIYGAKGHEQRYIDFLSPKWIEMLGHTTAEARRLGMGVDLTTGTGWPFGGPQVSAGDASSKVELKQFDVASGDTLAGTLPKGTVQCVRAVSPAGEQVDLTDKVVAGRLEWAAPAGGKWRVYAVVESGPVQKVKRAAPGGEGNVLDPYSVPALEHYLVRFDKALDGLHGPVPSGQFHDSFEYYGATWTPSLFDEFQKRRGYDLRAQLPAFFGDGPVATVARVKHDYRETIADLHLAYVQRWTDWAHGRGGVSRNQAHGAPGNLLDLYAAADVPETEIFKETDDRQVAMLKLASSAAHVTGRKLASAESFTWLGEHFQTPLSDVKRAADFLFLSGINHIVFHGIPYSPKDVAWPGWLFYASVNFGPQGGLWHDLPAFNAYAARVQSVLQEGRPDNDVLLYFPVHDVWQDEKGLLMPFTVHDQEKWLWTTSYYATATALDKAGYTYDGVSDHLLTQARVVDGQIDMGGNRYRALVLPKCRLMSVETWNTVADLARAGGTVVIQEAPPSDVPGLPEVEHRRAALRKAVAALKLTATGDGPTQVGLGRMFLTSDLHRTLESCGIAREPMVEGHLRFVRRRSDKGHSYFIVNHGNKAVDGWIPLGVAADAAVVLDPMHDGRAGGAALRPRSTTGAQVYLQLQPGESCVLRTFAGGAPAARPWAYSKPSGSPVAIQGSWKVTFLDGGPALPQGLDVARLASWTETGGDEARRFAGTARYATEIDAPADHADDYVLDLGRVCDSARVRVNGHEVACLFAAPFRVNTGGHLKPGRNTLEIDVTNLAANRIADLDRRGVAWKSFHEINFVNRAYKPFDASDWPPRDSGLLGPVTLTPLTRFTPAVQHE